MQKRIVQAALLATLSLATAAAHANGALVSSTSSNTVDNVLNLATGTTGYNFSDYTGSYSAQAVNGYYFSEFLFTFNPAANVQSATITLDNPSGVSGLGEQMYAWTGSFLQAAPATSQVIQSWVQDSGVVTTATISAPMLAAGSYVLEVGGTTAGPASGNFGGTISFVTAPVPEPSTGVMLLAGLALIGAMVRRARCS